MSTITLPTTAAAEITTKQAVYLFLDSRDQKGCSARTLVFYQERLRPFLAWAEGRYPGLRATEVTREVIKGYLAHLHDSGTTAATMNHNLGAVKALFTYLEDEEYVLANPARKIPKVKQPKPLLRVLSSEELARLLAAPDSASALGRRDAALLHLLCDTAGRISEILGLHVGDIDWRNNSLKVMGKGAKERLLPLGGDTKKMLLAHLQERGQEIDSNEWVFPSLRHDEDGEHKHLSVEQAQKICQRACKAAGIDPPVRPHALRRTSATLLLRSGASPFHVQALLGHSSLDMTRRYCLLASEDVQDMHKQHGVVDALRRKAVAAQPTTAKIIRLPVRRGDSLRGGHRAA